MIRTVSEIATKLRQSEGYRSLTDEQLIQYLETAHNRLCARYSLYRQNFNISITADVRTYALNPAIRAVWNCRYARSSDPGDSFALTGVDRDVYVRQYPGDYETQTAAGDPDHFYIEGETLGLIEIPVESTDGTSGYPRLELDTSVRLPLVPNGAITADLEIPSLLLDGMYYVYSVREQYCDDRLQDCEPDMVGTWGTRMQAAKERKEKALMEHDMHLVRINRAFHFVPDRLGSMF